MIALFKNSKLDKFWSCQDKTIETIKLYDLNLLDTIYLVYMWFRRPQDSDRIFTLLGILYRVLQSSKSHIHVNLLNSV